MKFNTRFVIQRAWQATPNLASRVLGLSLRRHSGGMLTVHGFPILLAESFVDTECIADAC